MVRAEVSNFGGIENFLAKNLPVKDTETHQQMMRMRTDDENFLRVLLRLFSGLISVQHRSLYDK